MILTVGARNIMYFIFLKLVFFKIIFSASKLNVFNNIHVLIAHEYADIKINGRNEMG